MNRKRWLWQTCKIVITILIVVIVGRQFARDLQQLDWRTVSFRPEWLLLSALLYLLGLGFSGLFWYRLLWRFGERPERWAAMRAYFVGHLGKYVPGKAVAVLLRANLIRGDQVRLGVAILSTFYEVLTTMAAGAILAAIIFTIQPPQVAGLELNPVFIGLLLVGLAGIPVLPGVFNRVVGRLAARFQAVDSLRLPRLTLGTLFEGLALSMCGWLLLNASAACVLNAVAPLELTLATALQIIGTVSLSYVAGFLILVVPGGIGVREYVLRELLRPLGASGLIDLAILLLRLVWTAAEVVVAGIAFFVPTKRAREASERT